MALQTPYLAAENSAQDRRSRSLYRFMVVSPAALLLAVGIVAHLNKPPHVGSAGDSEYDRRVLAYRERVAEAGRLIAPHSAATTDDCVSEANRWVKGFASGELQPLPPAAFEDHLRDSVRGEVMLANLALAARLSEAANHTLQDRKPTQAANLALLAAETAEPLGYSELISSVESDMTVRRALHIVAMAWPQVPAQSRLAFRMRLDRLKVDLRRIDELGQSAKLQIQDYGVRQRLPKARFDALKASSLIDRQLEAVRHGAQDLNVALAALIKS